MTTTLPFLGFGLSAALLASSSVAQKATDVRLDTDPEGTARSEFQQIAASGQSVYVIWVDLRHAPDPGILFTSNVYFNRSIDGGATWLSTDLRLNTNPPGTARSGNPKIAASGPSVYVTWSDGRIGTQVDIYFNRSLDGGSTWLESDLRLDTKPAGISMSRHPDIAASGSLVYVAWHDNRNGDVDIYFNRSLDGGTTWLASNVRVNNDPVTESDVFPPRVKIATSGSSVYVVWEGTSGLSFNRSLDSGATWLLSDVRLDSGCGNTVSQQITASGSSVYVTWQDARNFNPDIYFNRSLDGGATWLASDVRLDTDPPGAAESFSPKIAASGSSVYVTWEEIRNAPRDIYFNRSLDGGATWLASDVRLTTDPPGPARSSSPSIAASESSVYVAWEDERNHIGLNPPPDIYFNRSLDGGATWLDSDVRLDTDPPGTAYSTSPSIAASGSSVYVTWSDDRHGTGNVLTDGDIYFNIPFGSQPYGTGKTGSGGFVPRLNGTDSLHLGSTYMLEITNGLGGAAGLFAFGFAGSRTSIPVVGGRLLVNPAAVFPFVLGGTQDVPGDGVFVLDIPIPVDVNLLGVNLNAQAGILDPGATFAVSLTNGVEAWIL